MNHRAHYTGIFIIAFSTLAFEILLTRIFSVTMGYHFAFMAISLAMFGMTIGAIIVYLYPSKFPDAEINLALAKNTFYFSLSVTISFIIHLLVPFISEISIKGILSVSITYIIISIPFVFSGICISLLLTRFPGILGRLYAADLTGAAIACIFIIISVDMAGAVLSLFIISLTLMAATFIFMSAIRENPFNRKVKIFTLLLFMFIVLNTVMTGLNKPILRIFWIRGEYSEKPLWEKWNSFSRVSIDGDSTAYVIPFGWGLSNTYDRNKKVRQLMMKVDAHSTTVLTHFTGDTSEISHLKYDITNTVNYLKSNSEVLVIGSGAGRDVLSSILFGQKSTLAIEINRDMIKAITEDFGNFTGHLHRYPGVEFVGDEARSYLHRIDRKFDIIQISVIDDWKATASGTFVLMENALYTKQTWELFFDKLKPDGILTVTRSYTRKPVEHYKLVNIACDAMYSRGITDFRKHLVHLRCLQKERYAEGLGTGTLLVKRSPFTDLDLKTIDSVCNVFEFEKMLTPLECSDSNFIFVSADQDKRVKFNNDFPLDIKSPDDDRPFFFHLMSYFDLPFRDFWKFWDIEYNAKAVFIISVLLLLTSLLCFLCIVLPLKLRDKTTNFRYNLPFLIYFASIGSGFMLVEISLIQKLNIFLGHPSLSLACCLFTILLSSGTGSFFSIRLFAGRFISSLFPILLVIFITYGGLVIPFITENFKSSETYIRIMISVLALFPVGFVAGTAFPVCMRLVLLSRAEISAWLWGINGICGVMATVLAVIIAMSWGISYSYWTGVALYAIAGLSFLKIKKAAL